MTHTLVVNLFAGSGCGKSTTATGVFSILKMQGINAEYIPEVAKELCWLESPEIKNQAKVTISQYFRQCVPDGKVDVMITDSPLLLGCVYKGRGSTPSFNRYIYELFSEFRNLNFFLVRDPKKHPYNPKGRNQTEEEAIAKDQEIYTLMRDMEIPFKPVIVDPVSTVDTIVKEIKKNLICL